MGFGKWIAKRYKALNSQVEDMKEDMDFIAYGRHDEAHKHRRRQGD